MSPVEQFQATAWSSLEQANQLPIDEHARRAHRVGGPSLEQLRQAIRTWRSGGVPTFA